MAARLEAKDVKQRRKSARRSLTVQMLARIMTVDGTRAFRCEVRDISETGARLSTFDAPKVPDTFFLALSDHGTAHRSCEVMWRSPKELGVRFSK